MIKQVPAVLGKYRAILAPSDACAGASSVKLWFWYAQLCEPSDPYPGPEPAIGEVTRVSIGGGWSCDREIAASKKVLFAKLDNTVDWWIGRIVLDKEQLADALNSDTGATFAPCLWLYRHGLTR